MIAMPYRTKSDVNGNSRTVVLVYDETSQPVPMLLAAVVPYYAAFSQALHANGYGDARIIGHVVEVPPREYARLIRLGSEVAS